MTVQRPSAVIARRGRRRPLGAPPRLWVAAAVLFLAITGSVFVTQLITEVAAPPAVAGHHDFLAFHAAARLVGRGAAGQLYDAGSITALERQVIAQPVGAAGYMPYVNPPFAAAVQAPLGLMSEPAARVVWLLISVPIALLCCWLATAGLGRRERLLACLCLAGTFPFFQAFVEGQWSFVMLAGCLGALAAARSNHQVAAGLCLATLALKPPLLLPVLVVLVALRAWRTVGAALGAVAVIWLATLPLVGWTVQVDYAGYLLAVVGSHLSGAGAAGAAVWHGGISGMEGLNGLVAGYVGQQNVVLLDALTLAGVAGVLTRWLWAASCAGLSLGDRRGHWVVIAGIAAALLTDLHLYPQDCVLVLVALPLLTGMVRPELRLAAALGAAVSLDAAWLDQLAVTPHLFTWLLAAGFGAATWMALRASSAAAFRRPATVSAPPAR